MPQSELSCSALLHALNFDRALRHDRRKRADRRQHGRDDDADDTDGERECGEYRALLFDPDAPDVTGLEELPDGLDELVAGGFDGLPEGLLGHIEGLTARRPAEFLG